MANRTAPPPISIDPTKKYKATVHTSRGDFVISLVDPKVATQTVNNFVVLAQEHYYDGPDYKLPDESNPSTWPRGTVGMASSSAGVSGSQFFVTIGDAPFLASNGVYNRFGQVTSGMDVIDTIRAGDRMTDIEITAS
jgi:cyclophilin family peptidyl-prolyl cis-trans isomerase